MSRQRVVDLIAQSAPPAPPCFDNQADWKAWLASAHETGIRIVKRIEVGDVKNGRDRGWRHTQYEMLPTNRISYCEDCDRRRQQAMAAQDRCRPCDAEIAARGKAELPVLTSVVDLSVHEALKEETNAA